MSLILIPKALSALVGVAHLFFLYLEMFAWQTRGPKLFKGFPEEYFKQSATLAANQGLYNGFLTAGLVWSLLISDPVWSRNVAMFFHGLVLVAGIYGGMTASKKIYYVQALPALLGLVANFFLA